MDENKHETLIFYKEKEATMAEGDQVPGNTEQKNEIDVEKIRAEAVTAATEAATTAAATATQKTLDDAKKANDTRCTEIEAMGAKFKMEAFAVEHIGRGTNLDTFRDLVMERIASPKPLDTPSHLELGKSEFEKDKAGGFKSMSHFAHDIYRAGPGVARPSEVLTKWMGRAAGSTSQSVGNATSGGVLIPVQFGDQFMSLGVEQSDILSSAMTLPMETNALDIPYLDGFDESDGKVAGNVLYYWSGEEKQYVASDYVVGLIEMKLQKCTGLAFMTAELMKFSPSTAEPLLMNAFAKAYVKAVTKACIRGTGVGQPLGALNADCLISVDMEDGQPGGTLWVENMANIWARLYSESESGGGGTWYMNKTVVPQLLTMSLAVGTGGSAVFMNTVQEKPGFVGFGDPIKFHTQMSALGTIGDVLLADWSQYLIGQPAGEEGFEMSQSVHLKFDFDQTTFKFTFYMDGKPWWKEPYTPENGDTMSPFVTLAR